MGWKRSFSYLKHRLLRISDSSHSVALGLAIGFGVSFTPLLGTHFIQAGLIAYLLRGNAFAAIVGTFIGNPWTFPLFWWSGFSFGSFLFSVLGFKGADKIPDHFEIAQLWDIITTHPMTLFLPWMLGGYILFLLSVPPAYYVYYKLINAAKTARGKAEILRKKQKQKKLEVTAE